jgi:hypothetical protein
MVSASLVRIGGLPASENLRMSYGMLIARSITARLGRGMKKP